MLLSIHKIPLSQNAVRLIGAIDEFKGRWGALEEHTTSLQVVGDVAEHGAELRRVFETFRSHPIDRALLVRLCQALMGGATKVEPRRGGLPLIVQDGARIVGTVETAPPEDAPALWAKLADWLTATLRSGEAHPLVVIAVFAGVFLQIAPFEKGNQRIIRLLITLYMVRAGYGYAPYALLEAPSGAMADKYFNALTVLKDTLEQGKPDWIPWLEFVLETLKERTDVLRQRLAKDRDSLATMPELSQKIMKLFETNRRLQMKEIERLTRGRRATLKLRLGELVEQGYLKRHGQARSTWYARL